MCIHMRVVINDLGELIPSSIQKLWQLGAVGGGDGGIAYNMYVLKAFKRGLR